MMEAVLTSETSIYFNEATRCYIPESCHLIISLTKEYEWAGHVARMEEMKKMYVCSFCWKTVRDEATPKTQAWMGE
jgi:hypothetical protein